MTFLNLNLFQTIVGVLIGRRFIQTQINATRHITVMMNLMKKTVLIVSHNVNNENLGLMEKGVPAPSRKLPFWATM